MFYWALNDKRHIVQKRASGYNNIRVYIIRLFDHRIHPTYRGSVYRPHSGLITIIITFARPIYDEPETEVGPALKGPYNYILNLHIKLTAEELLLGLKLFVRNPQRKGHVLFIIIV